MKQVEEQQTAMGISVGSTTSAPSIPPQNHQTPGVGEFSTGLCDCFSDVSLCCLTCWCPCITFGRIAEIVDKGSSSCGLRGALYALVWAVVGSPCIYSCTYRQKIKAQYGMPENCFGDFCTHCWCEPCALCQEYRELQHHGYDVALGWHGNMERQGMPPKQAGMTRY